MSCDRKAPAGWFPDVRTLPVFRPLHRNVMILTYDDMLDMLADDDQEDDDLNLDELRDVPLLQLSQKKRDALFRNLQIKLDE